MKKTYRIQKCALLALVAAFLSLGLTACKNSAEPPGKTNQPAKSEHPTTPEHPK